MRILIINGYSKDTAGQKRFSEFQYVIMKICAEQNELVDTETECYIRDKDNLDDFLYEMDSGFLRKEAALNFDQLDIIFVCGDANIRPWSFQMRKVISILKMCIKVGKSCFACGFGMQGLIYLSASNMEKQINIMNGKGNGGKLTEIKQLSYNMQEIKHSDYFLDNTTGDLYGFSYETSEWIPKGNVGMHQRKSAQEYQSIGKFVLKAPTYKANQQHEQTYKLFKQRHYEDTCVIKKMYLQHWALEGMDREFICPMKNTWDVHTFAFTNPDKVFNVLAESQERGPIIIVMKNIIATMFPPDQKYNNTLKPIRNFIFYTLKKIKSQSNEQCTSIQTVTHLTQQTQVLDQLKQAKQKSRNKTLDLLNKRTNNMGFQPDQFKQNRAANNHDKKGELFRHVGYSAKKEHVPEFYSQNNMRENKIKLENALSQASSKMQFITSVQQGGLKKQKFVNDGEKKTLKFADDQEIQNISDIDNNMRPSTSNQPSVFGGYQKNNRKFNNLNLGTLNHNSSQNVQMQYGINPSQAKTLNKGNIRKMLHPQLSQDYLSHKKMWIPGQLSDSVNKVDLKQKENETLSKFTFHKTTYSKQNDSALTGLVKSNIWKGKFFSSFDQSIFTGPPQMTQEERNKRYELENDKKIMGNKSIKVFSGHRDLNKELSSVKAPFDASQKFLIDNKFREELKDKWVSKKDFKVI